MTMTVRTNLAGTIHESFQIGKAGPTVLQGDGLPPSVARSGDLYVRRGTPPMIFMRRASGWVVVGDAILTETADAATHTVSDLVSYVGVTFAGACSITIPVSNENRRVTIKDERGTASANPITIQATGNTIDGAASFMIAADYGSVTLINRPMGWFVMV